jgi:octaprenyl-diphosphate synthase
MQNGTAEQAALVRQAIEQGGIDELPAILAAIQSTGALEETTRRAVAEAEAAKQAISLLPPSQYRDSLVELADFAVTRRH